MKEGHMAAVVELIDKALVNAENEEVLKGVCGDVAGLMKQFPLYPELG
jgi:glycine/serine hydroxymethyltransferase